MGYEERDLYEDDAELIDELLRRSNLGIHFAELKRKGTMDLWPEPLIQFADLRFPTPSGRIEIASAVAVAAGHPRVPSPGFDAPPQKGHLRLLSPASKWQMNDSYGNDANVKRVVGEPLVMLNGSDMAALGITHDEYVELTNDTGGLVLKVHQSDDVPQGVALSYKGRWPKLQDERNNLNFLNPGQSTDIGDSSCVHGIEVRVRARYGSKRGQA